MIIKHKAGLMTAHLGAVTEWSVFRSQNLHWLRNLEADKRRISKFHEAKLILARNSGAKCLPDKDLVAGAGGRPASCFVVV